MRGTSNDVASEEEAIAAADRCRWALKQGGLREGRINLDGWQYWQGASRIVWLPPHGDTVYKIEIAYFGSNELEDANMSRWRQQGFAWAPETQLFTVNGLNILAMPYYFGRIDSANDIPDDAHYAGVPDLSQENFKRRPDGQVMLIDAGDVVPY
jgi:hypothetical protein